MPRRREVAKRRILPDPKFQDRLLAKFINDMMRRGEKSVAERVAYKALDLVQQRTNDDPIKTFKKALDNVKPVLEVKPGRSTTLALRWLVGYSRQRREKTMTERLTNELLDASNGLGASVKRREDMHKMAESNKAFAHYRW